MPFKYRVKVFQRWSNGRTEEAASFETTRIAVDGDPPDEPPDAVQVGNLFELIRQRKTLTMVFGGKDLDAAHAFREAIQHWNQVDLEITFLRYHQAGAGSGDEVAFLRLTECWPNNLLPAANGNYAVGFSVNGPPEEWDRGANDMSFRVRLWARNSFSDYRGLMADFDTDQIATPVAPLKPIVNEVVVGRMFQAIRSYKGLSIRVGGTDTGARQATHALLGMADDKGRLWDIDIDLIRDVVGSTPEVNGWDGWHPKVTYRESHRMSILSSLSITKAELKDYTAVEDGAWVALFKADQPMTERDFDQEKE